MADFTLSQDERDLILARRSQRAQAEVAEIEASTIPNILTMSASDYYKLTPEQKTRIAQQNAALALGQK